MGGSSSKSPIGTPLLGLDPTRGTYSGEYVQTTLQRSLDYAKELEKKNASWSFVYLKGWGIALGVIIVLILFILMIIAIVDYFRCNLRLPQILFNIPGPCNTVTPSTAPTPEPIYIIQATYGDNAVPGTVTATNVDVAPAIKSMLTNNNTYIPKITVNYSAVGLTEDPSPSTCYLYVSARLGSQIVSKQFKTKSGYSFSLSNSDFGVSSSSSSSQTPVSSSRPLLQQWWYGPSSGNLIPSMYDTTNSTSVSSSQAPISAEGQGSYGVQWWMFIKDWNHGYGKEKVVLSRSDASNGGIMNPKVTLAPTENNLKVAVSIFPSSEGGSSKSEPAPAGHSSSSDDIFVCEVPNIPLQSWISVSMTVFDRNLDIYINGNLVKSCFLPGVPKPAAGNIDLAKDGGFSGYMCDLNHYGKALTPSDAQAFYNAGTSCANQSGSSGASGGYSVKFGVFDTKGKEVKEYTF